MKESRVRIGKDWKDFPDFPLRLFSRLDDKKGFKKSLKDGTKKSSKSFLHHKIRLFYNRRHENIHSLFFVLEERWKMCDNNKKKEFLKPVKL